MWNIITIIFGASVLIFNLHSWFYYFKKTDRKTREKEGWNAFYLISTFLIIIVLLSRIGKI